MTEAEKTTLTALVFAAALAGCVRHVEGPANTTGMCPDVVHTKGVQICMAENRVVTVLACDQKPNGPFADGALGRQDDTPEPNGTNHD